MSRVRTLATQVSQIRATLDLANAPRIIKVGDVKERMLEELHWQIKQEGDDPDAPVILTPEEEAFGEEFSAFLEWSVQDIEETYNLRVVE